MGEGRPIVKFRASLPWAGQNRQNQSRCTLVQAGEYDWTVHVQR